MTWQHYPSFHTARHKSLLQSTPMNCSVLTRCININEEGFFFYFATGYSKRHAHYCGSVAARDPSPVIHSARSLSASIGPRVVVIKTRQSRYCGAEGQRTKGTAGCFSVSPSFQPLEWVMPQSNPISLLIITEICGQWPRIINTSSISRTLHVCMCV